MVTNLDHASQDRNNCATIEPADDRFTFPAALGAEHLATYGYEKSRAYVDLLFALSRYSGL